MERGRLPKASPRLDLRLGERPESDSGPDSAFHGLQGPGASRIRLPFGDPKDILHHIAYGPSRDGRVSEESAEVKRAGQHVQDQLYVEVIPDFSAFPRACKRRAHRLASRGQYLLLDDGRQFRILPHLSDESRQRLPQRSAEGIPQSLYGELKITLQTSGVRSGVISEFRDHRVDHQVAFIWPTAIETGTSTLNVAGDTVYGHPPIP